MSAATPEFVITRVFNAPRQRVWDAWTTPDIFARWFGPKGSTATVLAFDLRPGGVLHSRLESPAGTSWGKLVYREVDPPSRLVWAHSFADADGNIIRASFSEHWPLELLTTVTLVEADGGTKLTFTWVPINPTPAETNAFEQMMASMTGGWTGTFDQLDEVLAEAG